MPTAMEEEANKPKSSPTEVKQLQRYYSVLRDFMAYLHSRAESYPADHEFTNDELSAITPTDIIRWMNVKLYEKEHPGEGDEPVHGSHHTLDYYKKSISYFMPNKDTSWDPAQNKGNPTRSNEVNNLIRKVKKFEEDTGGSKKRKLSTTPTGSAKKAATVAQPVAPSGTAMQGSILHQLHAQNASFIDLFGTLSRTLEQACTTLQANNQAIMTEVADLKRMGFQPPAVPNRLQVPPPSAVAIGSGSGGMKQPNVATLTAGVNTGMLDWKYVHPDGVRRRVPPTWTFPHCTLEQMYFLWHCGDYQNRISPMKVFENSDVTFLGKRARLSLNEVKHLMAMVDLEASKKGKPPKAVMTLNEAAAYFQAGLSAFDLSTMTPTGKTRNIVRLKWSTLTKYTKGATKGSSPKKEKKDEGKPAAVKASPVRILPDTWPGWWYDDHDDGQKRRVPTTWTFPMLGLQEMYVLWHCGDEDNKIAPMKVFRASDVSLQKRSKTNLSEVRAIMTIIDLEAGKKGKTIKAVMTPEEAEECCRAGYLGLGIPATTQEGRTRDVLNIKWSSAVRLKNQSPKKASASPGGKKGQTTEVDI